MAGPRPPRRTGIHPWDHNQARAELAETRALLKPAAARRFVRTHLADRAEQLRLERLHRPARRTISLIVAELEDFYTRTVTPPSPPAAGGAATALAEAVRRDQVKHITVTIDRPLDADRPEYVAPIVTSRQIRDFLRGDYT